MTDLRETLVDMAVTHGDTRSRQDSEDFVDDILALIAERVTSDVACDDTAKEVESIFPDVGMVPRWETRRIILRALFSAGVVKGDH